MSNPFRILPAGLRIWCDKLSGCPGLVRLSLGTQPTAGCGAHWRHAPRRVRNEATCLPEEVDRVASWLAGEADRPEGMVSSPSGDYHWTAAAISSAGGRVAAFHRRS